ncbi:MAG: AsmA family protein [Hyphomicrobium sp.]|uniref:AsmA family protein n=1 Tax=Hyphomicrobium sp. TaxID=82 RepID=UPI0039E2F0F0
MNNGLLFLGGLLVAILAALFAVPNFVDWNSYRGVFEEEASKVLGRDVRVSGNVNVKILPVPYVRFEKIRIASVTGQTGEPFVRADSFTMWLSVPTLLRGVLEASQIELEKPVLSLAVDDKGIGNWTLLELKPGDLPFVPRDVALRSVQITDGAISLYNPASVRIAAVEGIDGVFSADGLKGPFRYSGSASWGGTDHDIKFATDVPGSDGAFALKLVARSDRSPNIYTLDGRVYNLSANTTFKGQWSGKVQVPGSPTVAVAGKGPPPLIDLRSNVTANAQSVKFDDLTLTVDNAAAPQTISGNAVASWASAPRFDVSLNSKWLDIDWLAGAGNGSAGFSKLEQLALGLMQSVASDRTASAKINLEQVKIGGENAGGLSIDADRQGSITHFKTFKISLPGGSRLDLAGDLKNSEGKLSFRGDGFIGGSSFGRFNAWAEKSGIPIDVNADGSYSAAGKLEIDGTRFFLTNASGDISGRPLAGELKITRGDRERTELTLQAANLDTQEVFPKTVAALRAKFRQSLGLASRDEDRGAIDNLPGDVRLRVIAGRLTDGDDSYRDVDVSFVLEGQKLSLPVAKLTTDSGLEIGLEARIDAHDGNQVGTLAYDLVGPSPDAMQDLVRKAGLAGIIGEDRFKGLKEGKIAGLVRLGARGPQTADVTLDGLLNGAKLDGGAEFDGGLEGWQTHPSRLHATLDSPSFANVLAILGREGGQGAAAPASATIIAAGTLSSGSMSQVEISSQDLNMRFQGRAQWPQKSDLALSGALDVKAARTDEALAVAGLSLPDGVASVGAKGTLNLNRDKGSWSLAAQNFLLGSSLLSGRVTVSPGAGAMQIGGDVVADRVSVPGLLSAVTDAPPVPAPVPVTAKGGATEVMATPAIWPEGLFDFAALGNTTASVKVGFKALEINGGLATGSGTMNVSIKPGNLTVANLIAQAAGGQLSGDAKLEKVANGVAFVSDLKLDQAKLASINSGGNGIGTFQLRTEGRAQSPAGLIAVMTGSGSAKFAGAEMSGPSAETVADVVDSVFSGRVANDAQAIANSLVAAVGSSRIPLANRNFAIAVSDGTLKISDMNFDAPDGNVEGAVTADLASLAMNASFQVTTVVRNALPAAAPSPGRTRPDPKAPLPPATILYSGSLDHLAAVSVNADAGDLQRELAVRQMERNVDELERVRRADEERARLEKDMERKRREAAERAAAQQKALQQQLPPVVPESAGTANPSASRPDQDNFWTPESAPAGADGQSSDRSTPEPQPQPQGSIAPADGVGNSSQTATGQQGQQVVIDPATGLPVAKQAAAVKPATARPNSLPSKPVKRRTSSDEVMKSLGGFP